MKGFLSFNDFPMISNVVSSSIIHFGFFTLDFSVRIESLLKLNILSFNGASMENVTLGPPAGTLRTAGDIRTESLLKSGRFGIRLAPRQLAANVLKKFQKEVPSVTA